MNRRLALLLLVPVLASARTVLVPGGDEKTAGAGPDFVLDRGEGRPALTVPRDETLVYRVYVDLALVDASVGTVTQRSTVEPYRESVLGGPSRSSASRRRSAAGAAGAESGGGAEGAARDEAPKETVAIELLAKGEYDLYSMDSSIVTRIFPQAWPHIEYRTESRGTEERRRRIQIGIRDGEPTSSYRRDTSRGAPKGQRIWGEPRVRTVPEASLDMLSAVMMTRTLIADGHETVSFPLVDKQRVWEVTLRRGERKGVKTEAGTFDAVEVRLDAGPYEGETIDEDRVERFEGLFGMRGGSHLWVEERTGVPIYIQGELPVGPITLGIEVVLDEYSGTPSGFAPRKPPERRGRKEPE